MSLFYVPFLEELLLTLGLFRCYLLLMQVLADAKEFTHIFRYFYSLIATYAAVTATHATV